MKIKYNQPIKDEQCIHKFEEHYRIQFPKDYLEFIKINNGGRPEEDSFPTPSGSEYIVNTFLSFHENDPENIYWPTEQIQAEGVDAIPFASDPSGNYFCFQNDKIVFWFHEDGKFVALCDSFEEFISHLIQIAS